MRIAGRVIHRDAPGSKAIVGGLFGRPLQIPPNVASGDFLSRLYRARRVKPYFDGVALHPYVADARAMGGAAARTCGGSCAATATARTPLYVTELGWGSDERPDPLAARPLRPGQPARQGLRDALRQPRCAGASRGVWWFTWTDEGGSCVFCHSAGLLTAKREAKPAWYRFNEWTGGDPTWCRGSARDELERERGRSRARNS